MSELPKPLPLQDFLARRIRELREARDWRQEDLAVAAREVGINWKRSTVAGIERRIRDLTVAEFLLLPLVFQTELPELFPGIERLQMTRETITSTSGICKLLAGQVSDLGKNDFSTPRFRRAGDRNRQVVSLPDRLPRYRKLWPGATDGQIHDAEQAANGDAEQKAAKKLGVEATVLSVVAHALWGQSLTHERDRRVQQKLGTDVTVLPRSRQALRGHVTRELLTELGDEFSRHQHQPEAKKPKP